MSSSINYEFVVVFEAHQEEFELQGDDTVEDVKLQIYSKFQVRPSQQIITGWVCNPTTETQALISFLPPNQSVFLFIDKDDKVTKSNSSINGESYVSTSGHQDMESEDSTAGITDAEASVSFIVQFITAYGDKHIPFHSGRLEEAIVEACFAPVESRKVIALYFHNNDDPFSKMFCPTLVNGEVGNILENSFYLIGWDVTNEIYHSALKQSLDENIDFKEGNFFITEKRAALLILYPIENSVTLFSVLHGPKVKAKDVVTALHEIEKNFKLEKENELALETLKEKVEMQNDIGSKEFQQLMYDRLGDRDYDCFEYSEHEYLKQKIGFAKYGPPQSENGYTKIQNKKIEEAFKQIQNYNNKYAEWQNQVTVSFIYNCLEPLPAEKLSRAKKYSDYNPKTDISPLPIFVVRKCMGSNNPCRIFIDHDNRVYNSWKEYIEENKLHKCAMEVPKDGRFQGNQLGEVLLERHLSPACGIGPTVLRGADIASTVAGLASGGVFVAAMIPAVAVAPVALTAAAVTGIGVGLYSVIRSGIQMKDRHTHGESMSFANSEARGAYINIVAGSLGFVGAGATTAVSQLAARGVNLGQGARVAFNTIGMMNIGASGVAVANSTYQVIDDWITEQRTPSLLTMVQLSSSILFFGNAVYNFRTAGTVIEEAQSRALQDYQDSLRSNRHRKTFDKMVKETIRQNSGDTQAAHAEVISAIRNIRNKDEVFAILTRNNKLFNKEGIRFAAENGEITLNGISVDLFDFGGMSDTQRTQFLIDLPPTREVPPGEARNNTTRTIDTLQRVFDIENLGTVAKYGQLILKGHSLAELTASLLQDCSQSVQEKVLRIFKALIDKLTRSDVDFAKISDGHFSNISRDPCTVLLRFVINFLKGKMNDLEARYEQEKEVARQLPDFNEDRFNKTWGVHPDVGQRAIYFFEQSVNVFVIGSSVDEFLLRELIRYVMNIITEKVYDYCNTEEKRKEREKNTPRNAFRITCRTCGGFYFSKTNS